MNDKSYKIFVFLKFGKEEFMKDLYFNGNIFMNSVQFFRKIEDEKLRGDNYEGVSEIRNLPKGDFEIPSINYKGKYESIHYKKSYENVLGNIYSLFCISNHGLKKPEDFFIDKKNNDFGSHCVLIKDVANFINRIEKEVNKKNLHIESGFVEYYNKYEVNKKISIFEKPKEYEYQKEFRFYVKSNSIKPLKICIGNLQEIAEIYESKKLIENIKLKKK